MTTEPTIREFTFFEEKKHSVRYKEVPGRTADEVEILGTVYIMRRAYPGGMPKRLRITVEVVE